MYHPAAALHQPKLRKVILNDFAQLADLISRAKEKSASDDMNNSEADEDDATQLSFF